MPEPRDRVAGRRYPIGKAQEMPDPGRAQAWVGSFHRPLPKRSSQSHLRLEMFLQGRT